MKRKELRDCFESIWPRAQLIKTTLERVHAVQYGRAAASRPTWSYAFATRLATAACALLLVLGIGVYVGRNGNLLSVADARGGDIPTPMNIKDATALDPAPSNGDASALLEQCEDMITRAKVYGSDFAVLSATVDAVYFVDAAKQGMDGRCAVVLCPRTVVHATETVADSLDTEDSLIAYAALSDGLINAISSDLLLGMHAEQGTDGPVWVIHEYRVPETQDR